MYGTYHYVKCDREAPVYGTCHEVKSGSEAFEHVSWLSGGVEGEASSEKHERQRDDGEGSLTATVV